jgi:hypothetical protein
VENYGAFDVSLISDLPLFIDPFLLFNSKTAAYRALHDEIIKYVRFLRDKSATGKISTGLLGAWYMFPEVHQTWLGFSKMGNRGRGLGVKFARALDRNLNAVFSAFGDEDVTRGSHLEKLCLFESGVGRDNISDLTTNLLKGFLARYTEEFALAFIPETLRRTVRVPRSHFNYDTESWESEEFTLPRYGDDFVLLCPKDILTKDNTWINRHDLIGEFSGIVEAVPNAQLRAQVDNFFQKVVPKDPRRGEWEEAVERVYREFPELIEYFIRIKEDSGDQAQALSDLKIALSERLYIDSVRGLAGLLHQTTRFYEADKDTYEEAYARVVFLKTVIEDGGGWRFFYVDGKPIRKEDDVQVLFRLTWYATPSDVSREVNDGRGPADFKVSRGALDKTLVEFKLGSNSQLKKNLLHQVEIYKKASGASHALKVIVFCSDQEHARVLGILKDIGLEGDRDIVLIDARADNKPSGSVAKTH